MYKILVLSDSHGDTFRLKDAIHQNADASAVIFLGDGLYDWESVMPLPPNMKMVAVKGNCDITHYSYPENSVEIFENKSIYITHGYKEKVKYGLDTLYYTAKEKQVNIALFGHTHSPFTSYDDGIYFLNPGSVKLNSCGIIEIHSNGILCYNKNIDTEINY